MYCNCLTKKVTSIHSKIFGKLKKKRLRMSDQAGEKKTRRSKSNQVKKKKKIVRKEVRPKKESPDAELTTETVCLQAHVKSV